MTQLNDGPTLLQVQRKGAIQNFSPPDLPEEGEGAKKRKPLMCSRCGLCYTDHRDKLAEACVFVENRYEALEQQLHGRGRQHDSDEDMFGIYRRMYVARMAKPVEGAQWSGMVTSLATMLLEKKLVDGVICVQAHPDTRFKPMPTLATTAEEVRAAAGNKPCLSHNLSALKQAEQKGVKRLAYIGNGCQTHALRAIQAKLPFEKIYCIGLPCTDIVSYQNLMKFMGLISTSAETVVHMEFMPDYHVWLRHEDGHTERVSYFALPMEKMGDDIFPDSCLSCFDYTNALSDITIGYLGASMPFQWILARTETGEELFEMLRPYLEFAPITESGKREKIVLQSIKALSRGPRTKPLEPWKVKLLTFVISNFGLKGVEFARATLTMKWARNLHFIRTHYPDHEAELVPGFARRVLSKFGM